MLLCDIDSLNTLPTVTKVIIIVSISFTACLILTITGVIIKKRRQRSQVQQQTVRLRTARQVRHAMLIAASQESPRVGRELLRAATLINALEMEAAE